MSQPCTNSEAVRRCLNIPIQPMSNYVARMQPKPPYAVTEKPSRPSRPFSGLLSSQVCLESLFVVLNIWLITAKQSFMTGFYS